MGRQRLVPSRDLPPVGRGLEREAVHAALRVVEQDFGTEGEDEQWIGAVHDDAAHDAAEDADAFETQYTQTWLRAVVAWGCRHGEDALVDTSAALLARMAGQLAAGPRACTYRFFLGAGHPLAPSEAAAHVCIRDIPLTEDALGGRTWGAAPYLARRLMLQYEAASPHRILELGAGTGLVGLALAAWSQQQGRTMHAVLTDHHATVLANLQHNATTNHLAVGVAQLDWQRVYDEEKGETSSYVSTAQKLPLANESQARAFPTVARSAQFDTLLAADCIYDPAHAAWIAAVAQRHLARTSERGVPELHLMLPLRRRHAPELQSVYAHFTEGPLQILREDTLVGTDDFGPTVARDRTPGRTNGNAVTFRHFVIGWV